MLFALGNRKLTLNGTGTLVVRNGADRFGTVVVPCWVWGKLNAEKWKGSFCHRFHRLSPGGRLGGGEKTLGHISEHRSRFLACSGALRLLQVIALCILDINIL